MFVMRATASADDPRRLACCSEVIVDDRYNYCSDNVAKAGPGTRHHSEPDWVLLGIFAGFLPFPAVKFNCLPVSADC